MGIVRKEDIHSTFDDYIRDMHSNPNLLVDGDFQVWQRGTNITCVPGVQYTADRWAMWTGGSPVISNNNGYGLKWVTGGNDNLIQVAELPSVVINTEMTLSFLINIESGTTINYGVDNGTQVSAENHTQRITKSYTGSGTWEKVILDIPKTLLTTNRIRIFFSSGSLQKTILLGYVKLELGSVVTPFVPRPYGEELALCKRDYEPLVHYKTYGVAVTSAGDGTKLYCSLEYSPKRIRPTITFGAQDAFAIGTSSGAIASKSIAVLESDLDRALLEITLNSSVTPGQAFLLQRNDSSNDSSVYVDSEIY